MNNDESVECDHDRATKSWHCECYVREQVRKGQVAILKEAKGKMEDVEPDYDTGYSEIQFLEVIDGMIRALEAQGGEK